MTRYTFDIRHQHGNGYSLHIWPSLVTKARRVLRTRHAAFRHAYAIAYDALSSGQLDTRYAHDIVTELHSAHDAGELSADGQLFQFRPYVFVVTITRSQTPKRRKPRTT